MKWKILINSFIIATLAITGCTERIQVDLDDSYTRLVVEGYFTTDTTVHTVKLTKTADYFSNKPAPPVSGAEVTINDTLKLIENTDKPGHYRTPEGTYGVIGETYQLKITDVDVDNNGEDETYRARSEIKSLAPIDSFHIAYREFSSQVQSWEILLFAQDPPDTNFYVSKVLRNDTLVTDTLSEWVVQDDQVFNGNYIEGQQVQFLDANKKHETIRKNDTITLEVNGITREYYQYFQEARIETTRGNPLFSGPPANPSGNIQATGGLDAVGFFSAYSISRHSIVVPDPEKLKEQANN